MYLYRLANDANKRGENKTEIMRWTPPIPESLKIGEGPTNGPRKGQWTEGPLIPDIHVPKQDVFAVCAVH